MLNDRQLDRMLGKLRTYQSILDRMIFDKIDAVGEFYSAETAESLYAPPADDAYTKIKAGSRWYGKDRYNWIRFDYTVPAEFAGKNLFVRPMIEAREGLLFVNGAAVGTFETRIHVYEHGNHYCDLIRQNAVAGETLRIDIEYYGGHDCPGTAPYDNETCNYDLGIGDIYICEKNEEIADYYFDLGTVLHMADTLPGGSFMRGECLNALYEVHNKVYYMPEDTDPDTLLAAIRETAPALKRVLSIKSGDSAPFCALTGHSHMDTAWLWHVGETEKKVARTYSNAISLMDQYPEYRFVQSSALHGEMIRKNYPELFARMQQKVAEGRYEPNGGVWVECDCNITSGESMIRQFLWGQRFTRKYFNYTSDCFWLPDTFGYSAAIPQIMLGCGVKYFLTTKISWNDTNVFPYDSFIWEGIDGSKVFTHFNRTHCYPCADDIIDSTVGGSGIKQRTVTNKRLVAYGYGDGGGGPQFEMIEYGRRVKDLAEVGKTEHMSVSAFMDMLSKTAVNPNTYKGELYLELHRGTLTNQHTIKRNNRKAELALRDLEIITVNEAVKKGVAADSAKIAPLYETLLKNQFHDILPGTCIHRAHAQSRAETSELIGKAREYIAAAVNGEGNRLTLINTLSFDRNDPVIIDYNGSILDAPCDQQLYTDLDGNRKLMISGLTIPAFSSKSFRLISGEPAAPGSISVSEDAAETPFAKIKFAPDGTIESFFDKTAGRSVKGEGYNLNTFIMAEDVPCAWDNWDVDADIQGKFRNVTTLVSREVVSDGAVGCVIRSVYRISDKSTVTQDMFLFRSTPEVRFDTSMDWQDDHRLLKVAFDTNINEDFARNEIQFGYAKRPTTRNNSLEQAKFEVCNHKYTDLSESRYGAAILNDCKYGISVEGGNMRLTLHKGGNHPDAEGDHDCPHRCVYSFLPHNSGFSAESVIRPAYELNVPVIAAKGEYSFSTPALIDATNVFIEAVKPCEDAETAYIVRLYEAEGTMTNARFTAPAGSRCVLTNMLEEETGELESEEMTFRPFEIKTVKVIYK